MESLEDIKKPTKAEQRIAMESYSALAAVIEGLHSENPEVEIEESKERIKIPLKALKLLAKVLKATSQGKPISIVPVATEMTTQAAAEYLGCSRPHLVKLLEESKIAYTKIGKHRRIRFEDLADYKRKMKSDQKKRLSKMMKKDEESGFYDS